MPETKTVAISLNEEDTKYDITGIFTVEDDDELLGKVACFLIERVEEKS